MSSEESGIGESQKAYLIPVFFARILTAPVGRVWRLTHFYSVALLLEKWFACFPTSEDSLHSLFCSLCTHLTVDTFIKLDCFLP